MEKIFEKIEISKDSTNGFTEVNGKFMSLQKKLSNEENDKVTNTLINMKSNPIFTNKSYSFGEEDAAVVCGDNSINRKKMIYLMSLLKNKSGESVFKLVNLNEKRLMLINPSLIETMVVECVKIEATKLAEEEAAKIEATKLAEEEAAKIEATKLAEEEAAKTKTKGKNK